MTLSSLDLLSLCFVITLSAALFICEQCDYETVGWDSADLPFLSPVLKSPWLEISLPPAWVTTRRSDGIKSLVHSIFMQTSDSVFGNFYVTWCNISQQFLDEFDTDI